MKRGFTLMEVNMAMLIMAGGILAMVSLYSLGYRENRQSRDDVLSAALADEVFSPLMMAISATNLKWSVFKDLPSYPGDSWEAYFDNAEKGVVTKQPHNVAQNAYNNCIGKLKSCAVGTLDLPNFTFPSKTEAGGLNCALLIQHEQDSPIVRLSFRATRKPGQLFSMPLYYTEVRFQGDPAQ